jgi:hypothetical protein
MNYDSRHMIPVSGGFILKPEIVKANKSFDKMMETGLYCSACARRFSEIRHRGGKHTDMCVECEKAFD